MEHKYLELNADNCKPGGKNYHVGMQAARISVVNRRKDWMYREKQFGPRNDAYTNFLSEQPNIIKLANAFGISQAYDLNGKYNPEVKKLLDNGDLKPTDVWRVVDETTIRIEANSSLFTIMNDLRTLDKPISIGKLAALYRVVDDTSKAHRSMSGQIPREITRSAYSFDGTAYGITQSFFGREWREVQGLAGEYDWVADERYNASNTLMTDQASLFLDGDEKLTHEGYTYEGIRDLAIPLNLGAGGLNVDMSSSSTTYASIERVFIEAVYLLNVTNRAAGQITFYVSDAIWKNLMRKGTNDTSFETFLSGLSRIPGVAAIKNDSNLATNEMIGIVLSQRYIHPLVGMPMTVTPVERLRSHDDVVFECWQAIGLQIPRDSGGRRGVMRASA